MATLKPVNSSNIHSMGYCPASRVLAVRFKRKVKGAPSDAAEAAAEVYHHLDVPPEIGETLVAMDSGVGSAYAQQVRGKFAHEIVPA